MNVYVTPDEIKLYLGGGLEELVDNKDDVLFKRFAVQASRAFDSFATNGVFPRRHFYPVKATRSLDHPASGSGLGSVYDTSSPLINIGRGKANLLPLQDDLLELSTLTTKNGQTTITSSDYLLLQKSGDQLRYGRTPYNAIGLQPHGTVTEFTYLNTPFAANAAVGFWGYHDDWTNAWEDSGDEVEDNPLSDSATAITVNDADGDDINGLPYRFKTMQLIRIEDEYLHITAVDASGDTLTVRRGVNGTTAASHAQNSTIEIFRPMADIQLAMLNLVTFVYRRKDSIGTPDERPLAAAQGVLIMPPVIPKEVDEVLRPYKKHAL